MPLYEVKVLLWPYSKRLPTSPLMSNISKRVLPAGAQLWRGHGALELHVQLHAHDCQKVFRQEGEEAEEEIEGRRHL